MGSKRSQEGEVFSDHRNSPGLTPEFLRKFGMDPAMAGSKLYEAPIMACAHCPTYVVLNPQRTRPRNYCRKCDAYVCDNPACSLHCTPRAKTLDDALAAAHRATSVNPFAGFQLRKD